MTSRHRRLGRHNNYGVASAENRPPKPVDTPRLPRLFGGLFAAVSAAQTPRTAVGTGGGV